MYDDLAKRYLETWNETDPARRRELIEQLWTADGTYVDPLVSVAGWDQLDATIAAVQGQFPAYAFRLAGPVDGHHDLLRFTWELGPADAPDTIVGFDVALVSDGRLTAVHGFLDKVPAELS